MSLLLRLGAPSLASSRPTIAAATTNTVATLASSRRLVHSKSLYARGRSAIRASQPLRRQSSQKDANKKRKKQPDETTNPWTWPKPFWPSSASASASSSVAVDKKFRHASETWPRWLPKTGALQQWEMQQQAANNQQQAANNQQHSEKPHKAEEARTRSTSSTEEVQGVFIRKGDPRHSEYQHSTPSSNAHKDKRKWPSWLPPRPDFPQRRPSSPPFNPRSAASWGAFAGRHKIFVFFLSGLGLIYMCNLERVPYTGRWRFRLFSDEDAAQHSQAIFRELMAQYDGKILSANHPLSKATTDVVRNLLGAAADLHGLEFESVSTADARQIDPFDTTYARDSVRNTRWQVFVINDPNVSNAFVLPSGQIFIFTGMMAQCQDVHALASVLSHEIAHVLCSHPAEKMSQRSIGFFLAALLDLTYLFGSGQVITQWLLSLPNSRKLEQEADALGLRLMSRACYDPRAAPLLWQRMAEQQGEMGDNWIAELSSTHPLSSKRMESIQAQVPAALQIRQEKGCPSPEQLVAFKEARLSRTDLPRRQQWAR